MYEADAATGRATAKREVDRLQINDGFGRGAVRRCVMTCRPGLVAGTDLGQAQAGGGRNGARIGRSRVARGDLSCDLCAAARLRREFVACLRHAKHAGGRKPKGSELRGMTNIKNRPKDVKGTLSTTTERATLSSNRSSWGCSLGNVNPPRNSLMSDPNSRAAPSLNGAIPVITPV